MCLELSHRFGRGIVVFFRTVHIQAFLGCTFAEEVYGVACIDRAQILAGKINKTLMFACSRRIAPYIACYARCMVLAPYVFEAFHIFVYKAFPIGSPRQITCGSGKILPWGATVDRDCI